MRITISDIDLMLRDGLDIMDNNGSPALLAVRVFAWKNNLQPDDVNPRQASLALKQFTYCVKNDLQPRKQSPDGASQAGSKGSGTKDLLDSLFHLAGVIGVNPRDLTVRELSQMGKPHQKKQPKVKGQSVVPVTADNLELLKSVFVKDTGNDNPRQDSPFRAQSEPPVDD